MVRTLAKGVLLPVVVAGLFTNPVVTAADELPAGEDNASVIDELSLGDLLSMKITTGSFLELDLQKSPLSMTVITKEMVRTSGARHISELLEIYVPGFVYNINKYYGFVWGMRGVSNDRNTKVIYLVNGHKMNNQARDGFQGETSLGLLGDIERVEVLRGPAGLVYGSGAIAGIVNVVTKKADDNKSCVTVNSAIDGSKSVEANLFGAPKDGRSFSVSAGYKQSDGLPLGGTRIYPPAGNAPDVMGVPSDGRFGSTDGNWKVSGELTVDNFNIYFRGTRQKENGASYFTLAPWPEKSGTPDASWGTREIDGKMVPWDDPFWKGRNTWRTSRKNYLSDNFISEASYKLNLGDNELKTKLSFDMNTTSIGEEKLDQYRNDFQYKNGRLIETFGERRYLLSATYLLKTVQNLQAAFGIEDRIDDIGNNIIGKNEQLWNPKHFIVSDIVYNTFALFGEGLYDINDQWGVHGGLRLDVHTRATFLSPKVAAVYRPNDNHSFKLIYQSAANNGSADNYEYNRYQVDNNGNIVKVPTLVSPAEKPTDTAKLVQPAELSKMHKLKPERVHSFEATYVGKLMGSLTVEPSVSYNIVNDLFVWEQQLFRVVNVGEYSFGTIDFSVNYANKYVKIGANHTYQRPWGTDVEKQKKTFKIYSIRDSVINGDTVYGAGTIGPTGDSVYTPFYEKSKDVSINLVKKAVTYDGLNFLSLPTHMTKLYVTVSPFEWVSLGTNLRLIWGFPGRDAVLDSLKDTANYFGYYGEKEPDDFKDYFMKMVSKKWNVSLSFFLPGDVAATFMAYNVLGTDRHNYTEREPDKNTVNALRVEQMYDYGNREAYSVDQCTFGVSITKSF